MPSRVYVTAQATTDYPTMVPVGFGNLLQPILTRDDNAYDVGTIVSPSALNANILMSINYDSAIPPASSIYQITHHIRRACTSVELEPTLSVGSNLAFNSITLDPVATPSDPVSPDKEQWQDDEVVFDSVTAPSLPMTIDDFMERLNSPFHQSLVFQFPTTKPAVLFIDYFDTEIFFTLEAPTNVGTPTFYGVKTNRFSAQAVINMPPGSANVEYPLTAWFEYTNIDPSSDDFANLSAGAGRIFETDPQELVNTGTASRTVRAYGTSDNNLTPNTTYYVRCATETADGTFTYGSWTTVTTLQFDNPVSY